MHERLRTGGKAGRDFRTSVSCHILTPIAMISIFLLCLSSVSFAQGAESLFLGVLPTWWILLAGAFAIGFGLAAIAYMASTVFRLPELSVWAKSEVGEMVATGLIVGILLIAVTAADGIFKAATGQTAMEQTLSFTNDITNKQMEVYFDSLEISKAIGLIAGNPPQYATGGGSSGAAEKKRCVSRRNADQRNKGGWDHYPRSYYVNNKYRC